MKHHPSIKVSRKVQRELIKILPTGASMNKKFSDQHCPITKTYMLNHQKITFRDNREEHMPNILAMLENKKIKSKHSHKTFTHISSLSPKSRKGTKIMSPLETSQESLQASLKYSTSYQTISKDPKTTDLSCHLETVNEILTACNDASTPKKLINRTSLRKFTKNINTLVGGIGDYFATPPESLLKSKSKAKLLEEQQDFEAGEALKLIRSKVKEFKFRHSLRSKNFQ